MRDRFLQPCLLEPWIVAQVVQILYYCTKESPSVDVLAAEAVVMSYLTSLLGSTKGNLCNNILSFDSLNFYQYPRLLICCLHCLQRTYSPTTL